MSRPGRLLPLVLVGFVLGSCGAKSEADRVRATLAGFATATAKRDYQALCDTYLAPKLVDQVEQTGLPCEAAVRPAISQARQPTLTIRSVQVRGATATAEVHTTASNQPPSDDTIALVKVGGTWRIASLAQAGPQPTAP
jgi:hypothetical protein